MTVELAEGQPKYTIHEGVAWDRIEATTSASAFAAEADAICFGSLAQRAPASRQAVRRLLDAASRALVVFDANLRPPFVDPEVLADSMHLADVLKVNDHELDELGTMFGVTGSAESLVEGLARRFDLTGIAVTRGEAGSLLFVDGRWSDHQGEPVKVVDAIGAGDAFTAVLTLGLLEGRPLDEINRRANAVAAYVCTQPGGTPALPASLIGEG